VSVPAGRGFLQGVFAGAAFATAAVVLAGALLAAPGDLLDPLAGWVGRNLGVAAVAFLAVGLAWLRTLGQLRTALSSDGPAGRVVHLDGLAEVWVGLFFGVGVIWTAIGMRAALLHAIGPGGAAASGATMLARLVDGGILLSLSTTIVGGIGGYLMRVAKTLWLGPALRGFYQSETSRDRDEIRAVLERIDARLEGLSGFRREARE
jgi:hypothetical protein